MGVAEHDGSVVNPQGKIRDKMRFYGIITRSSDYANKHSIE